MPTDPVASGIFVASAFANIQDIGMQGSGWGGLSNGGRYSKVFAGSVTHSITGRAK